MAQLKRTLLVASPVLAAALVLSACGGSNNSSGEAGGIHWDTDVMYRRPLK